MAGLLAAGLHQVKAAPLVTGFNVVNPMMGSEVARDAVIPQLQAAGVHLVRFGLQPDAQSMAFARALNAAGIKIDLIVPPQYPPDAPKRAYDAAQYPQMWGGHPLSYADPQRSSQYFQTLLGMLDANGIQLAGLELGNEINWTAFNQDFPLPGKGMVFGLADLQTDPEAEQIAKGYLQYLKVLAVLKQARDGATLNRNTPIILGGLAGGGPEGPEANSRLDKVSIDATLDFMRAHGLDNLVDAYGIHIYPRSQDPAALPQDITQYDAGECRAAGQAGGKPCWVTEWGVGNNQQTCPLDESKRLPLIQAFNQEFETLNAQGRVAVVIYFSWDSSPGAKKPTPFSVYRCGGLTAAGQLAASQ
jgi:hypothetical protein